MVTMMTTTTTMMTNLMSLCQHRQQGRVRRSQRQRVTLMTRQYSVQVSTVNIPTQLLSCQATDCVETRLVVVSLSGVARRSHVTLADCVMSHSEVMSCYTRRSYHVMLVTKVDRT